MNISKEEAQSILIRFEDLKGNEPDMDEAEALASAIESIMAERLK